MNDLSKVGILQYLTKAEQHDFLLCWILWHDGKMSQALARLRELESVAIYRTHCAMRSGFNSSIAGLKPYYDTVNKLAGDMSSLLVELVIRKTPETIDKFLRSADRHIKELVKRKIEDRDSFIYGVVLAGLELLCQDIYSPKELSDLIHAVYDGEAQRDKIAKEEENELSIFWSDISVLISDNRISDTSWKFENEKLYMWFPLFYNIWSKDYRTRTGDTPFSKTAILDQIKEESYFIEKDISVRLSSDLNKRCLVLDFSKCPDTIRECFNADIKPK